MTREKVRRIVRRLYGKYEFDDGLNKGCQQSQSVTVRTELTMRTEYMHAKKMLQRSAHKSYLIRWLIKCWEGRVLHLHYMSNVFLSFSSIEEHEKMGNSMVVQWLGLLAFTAKGQGSIPGGGTKIPQAMRCSQKNKHKQ